MLARPGGGTEPVRRVVAVAVALLAVAALPASAQAAQDPRFEVFTPEPRLEPGATQTVTVELVNDDEASAVRVKTATNVRVTPRAGTTPFEILSGPQSVGRMAEGEVHPVAVRLEVPADASAGTYRIPISVSYEFDEGTRRTTTVEAVVVVPERPIVRVESVDADVFQEETGLVRVRARNAGTRTANAASMVFTSPNPAVTLGGSASTTVHVGDWQNGSERTVVVPVTTTAAASARTYPLEYRLTYRDRSGIEREGPPSTLAVPVAAGTRFAVADTAGTVPLGETDDVAVTLRNRGNATATDASVTLEATSPTLRFGNRSVSREFVGRWEPGEARTVSAEITAARSGTPRRHSIQAVVGFAFPGGVDSTAGPVDVGVDVTPAQAFAFEDVTVDLRGSTAFVSAAVTNEDDRTVRNAVGVLESADPAITVTDPSAPVGDLEPGASARVTFELRVAPDAPPGPRELRASVRYDRGGERTYRTRPEPIVAGFPTDRRLFSVEAENATLERDASNRLAVRLRNEGDEPLREIRARLGVAPPYESESPTSYVGRLGPGESTTLTFELTTPGDSVPTTDSLTLNVTAKTEAGRTVRAGPYVVPFSIPERGVAGGGVLWLVIGVAVVAALLAAGWWWLNQ